MGILHDPITWYRINYAGMQLTQWDFQNKGTPTSPARLSFVLKVPLTNLRPSMIYCTMWPDRAKGPLHKHLASLLACKTKVANGNDFTVEALPLEQLFLAICYPKALFSILLATWLFPWTWHWADNAPPLPTKLIMKVFQITMMIVYCPHSPLVSPTHPNLRSCRFFF